MRLVRNCLPGLVRIKLPTVRIPVPPKGTDEALVPVDLPLVKEARIGQAIMDADIVISLNHFKGHEEAGFGGALKNLGMGSGSRSGKMEQHWDTDPNHEYFHLNHPDAEWKAGLIHAEEIGLGTRQYELVRMI